MWCYFKCIHASLVPKWPWGRLTKVLMTSPEKACYLAEHPAEGEGEDLAEEGLHHHDPCLLHGGGGEFDRCRQHDDNERTRLLLGPTRPNNCPPVVGATSRGLCCAPEEEEEEEEEEE